MEIERRHVEQVKGLSNEIGYYLTACQFGREQTKKLIEDLTREEIARRYLPELHSVGALAMHLGECEYWYIQCIAAEKELTEEGKALCHFCDTTENDIDKGYTADYLIDTLDR